METNAFLNTKMRKMLEMVAQMVRVVRIKHVNSLPGATGTQNKFSANSRRIVMGKIVYLNIQKRKVF